MSGHPIRRAFAIAATAVLVASLAVSAAPPEGKPDAAAKAEARVEAGAERQARAEEKAEARAAKKAATADARTVKKAAKAEARAAKKAAKAERKQAKQKPEKVTLCHKPDTSDEVTISVGAPAVEAHLRHGDYIGECGAPPVVVTITTSSLVINPDQRLKLIGAATGMTSDDVSYEWSSTCFTKAQLIDPSVIACRPNTSLLIIRENTMAAGAICAYTLTVTDNATGRVGSETIEVTVNDPPSGGSITVTPSSGGVALQPLFELTASGWADPQTPLYYRFSYKPDGSTGEIALTQLLLANTAEVYLPAGVLDIEVRVYDSMGASSTASTEVTVIEP